MNLLADLGRVCNDNQKRVPQGLKCKELQCDEICNFVGCKEKNATPEKTENGEGAAWTWVALDRGIM